MREFHRFTCRRRLPKFILGFDREHRLAVDPFLSSITAPLSGPITPACAHTQCKRAGWRLETASFSAEAEMPPKRAAFFAVSSMVF